MKKLSLLIALCAVAAASNADLVFDNITGATTTTSTGSTPNTFMGGGYNLLTGTNSITGFDVTPVNLSGTSFTSLKAIIYVWGTVNTGTVSTTAPAFSNLLGTYTATLGALATGYYSTTTLNLTTPLAISSTTIGMTFNFQGSTDGVNFASSSSLTSLITAGTGNAVGSNVFNGYYRNANSETNGNFTSALRTLGLTNQSVGVRVYGNVTPVPEPGTMVALGLGAVAMLRRRKKA